MERGKKGCQYRNGQTRNAEMGSSVKQKRKSKIVGKNARSRESKKRERAFNRKVGLTRKVQNGSRILNEPIRSNDSMKRTSREVTRPIGSSRTIVVVLFLLSWELNFSNEKTNIQKRSCSGQRAAVLSELQQAQPESMKMKPLKQQARMIGRYRIVRFTNSRTKTERNFWGWGLKERWNSNAILFHGFGNQNQ